MQQYFVGDVIAPETAIIFNQDQIHHMMRVMRFETGDRVLTVDCEKKKYLVELEVRKQDVLGHVIDQIETDSEFPLTVIVAQGIIKGDRFDMFLQKVSELGAHRIIPLVTSRTVVKIQSEKEEKKRQRWQKIVTEAAEQSRRLAYPIVEEVMSLADLVSVKADVKLVAYEEQNQNRLAFRKALSSLQPNQTVLFVAGCEGGFDRSEIDYLTEHGFICCGLGPRILRAETAAMYALSALSYEMELQG